MSNLIITNPMIMECLIKEGIDKKSVNLADAKYVLPTEEAIKAFGKRYLDFLWSSGLDKWRSEIWDCDDFAFGSRSLASIDNALWQNATGNTDCGLAFGIAWVMTMDGGHAINIAIYQDESGSLGVHYYEPQLQSSSENIGEPFVCLQKISRDSFLFPLWYYL